MSKITLKDDRVFLVCNESGDIQGGPEGYGMYLNDMRFLSLWELKLNGEAPISLSHTTEYNYAAIFRLSNQFFQFSAESLLEETGDTGEEPTFTLSDLLPSTTRGVAPHTVSVARRRVIKNGLHDTIELNNFYPHPLQIELSLVVACDLKDIFEIRGFPRQQHGQYFAPQVEEKGKNLTFSVTGLDKVERSIKIGFSKRPTRVAIGEVEQYPNGTKVPVVTVSFLVKLPSYSTVILKMEAVPQPPDNTPERVAEPVLSFEQEVENARRKFAVWRSECSKIETEKYVLNQLFRVSTLDLRSLMQSHAPQGLAVTAGIPWYFTLFGRDSIITALQTLSLNPQVAVDTLRVLAVYQGTKMDDWRDEEPGKILHELRRGEMVRTGELPHNPYYGSVDATPLFVLLFAETVKWLGEASLFEELWPNIGRALDWMSRYGDPNGDGYIEYTRRSQMGILHQGWKDSDESMGGQTGPRPKQPIALVEVQGYVYAAKQSLADVVARYGDAELAATLQEEARQLKEQFNRDFWWEEEGFFVQALDGDKQPVKNVTSNPGHCLWSGIVDEDKAERVVARLTQTDMLNGWGIRTISGNDPTYNPMSYHNGSIWPHDNSLIVAGLQRYGFYSLANLVASQIIEAGLTFADYRLPELYCGFEPGLKTHSEPAAYPVSCSPQAWAAATPFLLVQSMLGLKVDGINSSVELSPHLPDWLDQLRLRNLQVGQSRLDLLFRRDVQTGTTLTDVENNPSNVTIQLHQSPEQLAEQSLNATSTLAIRLRGED